MPGIAPDDSGLVAALVGGGNLDLLRSRDDVVVGEDVSLLVEDKARALALFRDDPKKKSRVRVDEVMLTTEASAFL